MLLTITIYFCRNSEHFMDILPACIYFVLMLVSKPRKRKTGRFLGQTELSPILLLYFISGLV